jgi:spore germination protein
MRRKIGKKKTKLGIIAIYFLAGISVVFAYLIISSNLKKESPGKKADNENSDIANEMELMEVGRPEISGWIAWWNGPEEDGYRVIGAHSEALHAISPGWLNLKKDGNLVEIGNVDKLEKSAMIRAAGLRLLPMLITDMNDAELADFAKDPILVANFLDQLTAKIRYYQAEGFDLDFENIGSGYRDEFSLLVRSIAEKMKEEGLYFSLTIQAQTGKNDWDGILGQDLPVLAAYPDEIRLMIYDRHGYFSKSGPITPMEWYKDVIDHNLRHIPEEKLVIGLPTYAYLWHNDGNIKSYQYKDFIAYAEREEFEIERDSESFELRYENSSSVGWLSDSFAVIKKIDYARNLGLNRFAIWNLGGTDEKVLQEEWETIMIIKDR